MLNHCFPVPSTGKATLPCRPIAHCSRGAAHRLLPTTSTNRGLLQTVAVAEQSVPVAENLDEKSAPLAQGADTSVVEAAEAGPALSADDATQRPKAAGPPLQEVIRKEVDRRRNFAIISHPDAGKTTMTEKLLLYGGAINEAGEVKARRASKSATSDWMDLEKQRGISITSTALTFDYKGSLMNLLDTPGHQDFSEDTYRCRAGPLCHIDII